MLVNEYQRLSGLSLKDGAAAAVDVVTPLAAPVRVLGFISFNLPNAAPLLFGAVIRTV